MLLQNRFLLHFLPKHNCQKLAIFGIKSSMNNWRAISCNKICKYLYLRYQKHAPARDFASSIFSRKCIYLFFEKKCCHVLLKSGRQRSIFRKYERGQNNNSSCSTKTFFIRKQFCWTFHKKQLF